jgi:hypothetical protein
VKTLNILRILVAGASTVLFSACAASDNGALQMARERNACVDVGIAPGSDFFSQCVADLDATMSENSFANN